MIHIPAPMHAPEQLFKPFTSDEWIYELKFDGYRCMAGTERNVTPIETRLQLATESALRVRLLTKSGRDCSEWFPEIGEALALLPGGPHVIDGEACVLRSDGTSDFNLLQARARKRKQYPGGPPVTYCAFDLLVHHGQDIKALPLVERKARLEQLLAGTQGVLFVKDLPADENLFHSLALPPPAGLGLEIEGVMAKRKDSPYSPGVRSDNWRKIKRPGWREGRLWTK